MVAPARIAAAAGVYVSENPMDWLPEKLEIPSKCWRTHGRYLVARGIEPAATKRLGKASTANAHAGGIGSYNRVRLTSPAVAA